MGAPDTVAARQAALLVHGLDPAARGQVLERLDAAQAARIGLLLEELDGLGWQRARSPRPGSGRGSARAAPPVPTVQEQAARLRAEDVAQALTGCSAWTAARLLSVRDWPWKAQALGRLPALRRQEIRDALQAGVAPLPPAVADTLCECLLREAPRSAPSSGRPALVRLGVVRKAWLAMPARLRRGLAWRPAWIR
jgi:hypothetical protein